jgi:hypothetical protein
VLLEVVGVEEVWKLLERLAQAVLVEVATEQMLELE